MTALGAAGAWAAWLGTYELPDAGTYPPPRVAGLILTAAVLLVGTAWRALHPRLAVDATAAGLVVGCCLDLSRTATGDGNLLLFSLLLFGLPLYAAAVAAALLLEHRQQRRGQRRGQRR